jgi:hypothetical protein
VSRATPWGASWNAIAHDNRSVLLSGSELASEGIRPVAVTARRPGRAFFGPLLAWVRERLTTTPGRLALVSIAVVIGAVCFGVVADIAEQSREQAANSARTDTEPLLAQAVALYASLSDANATATTTFLVGGLEPASRRARYLQDVLAASDSLATLSREVGATASARTAVATVTRELPIYTGLVEAARANNRQGLPVGAAYLRQASDLLKRTILPAAGQLYTTEAKRLRDDYGSGTSTAWLVAFIAAVGLALASLLYTQLYLTRISHRILNMPMVVATVLLAALLIWGVIGLTGEQNSLATAQRDGSDSVEVLSAARILVSRAQSDESLTLIARGGDTTDPADFAAVIGALGQPNGGGLAAEVMALARRTGTVGAARDFERALAVYLAEHAQITADEQTGDTSRANALVAGSTITGQSPADRVSASLVDQVAAAQGRFERSADDATSALSGLSLAIGLLMALAAGLTLVGLRLRLSEYR